ncbi:hypothetical protein GCM10022393_42000 [Aquimarina addita]|uniref:Peptidase M48 domain-containing protein n=1 Tax=Aquimarina addita TaxID=870485 RepID=A0ABP6UUN7_9FLAO
MRNFFKSNKEAPVNDIASYKISIPKKFDINQLYEYLEIFLQEHKKKEYYIQSENDELTIHYDISIDVKKQKKTYTSYEIVNKGNQLIVECNKVTLATDTQEKSIVPVDLYSKKQQIVETIVAFTNNTWDTGLFLPMFENKIEFIAALSALEKNFLLSQLDTDAIYLACLGITNLKTELLEVLKNHTYYFILTSTKNILFGTDGQHFIWTDITGHHIDFKEKIGKDSITSSQFSFDTELFNDWLFAYSEPLFNQISNKRIEKYGDILFDKYDTKEEHLQLIEKIYTYQIDEQDQLRRTIKSQLVHQFTKKKCDKKLVTPPAFKNYMYSEPLFGNIIYQIMSDWDISEVEQYNLLELLLEGNDNFKLKYLDVFYDAAIVGLYDKKGTSKNIEPYRIKHLQYLKDTKQYKKAIPFYEFTLENLDDDSILELISDTETNILNGEDCHPLRIQLLEDLSEIKTTVNQSNAKELLELAQLQPLVLNRLTQLVAAGIHTEKANNVLSLFMEDAFQKQEDTEESDRVATVYTKDELFNTVVPDCFNKADGFMNSFTSLIAKVTPPDYGQVTMYSEKLSLTNYPEAFSILEKLVAQLQLSQPECYIGNGDFSRGIIGVEGTPNFLILGKDHLQPESPYYFSTNELTFNLALELTHILFGHTRVTSKDVWRGAKSKGMDLAGALLIALPVVSTVGNYASKFVNITKYTNVLTGIDKVANVVERGQTAVEYGEKITDKFTNNKKESELLATSRLMEISADRVGLLLTNNIKGCMSVLLKTSDDFVLVKDKINKEGLYKHLEQKNDKGEFIHQELIIRIKTLCSFYLTQDKKIS